MLSLQILQEMVVFTWLFISEINLPEICLKIPLTSWTMSKIIKKYEIYVVNIEPSNFKWKF